MKNTSARRRRPRFSLGLLMLLTLVVAVAAAGWGGMLRDGDDRAFFVLFTLIAPLWVLVVVSLWQQITCRRK